MRSKCQNKGYRTGHYVENLYQFPVAQGVKGLKGQPLRNSLGICARKNAQKNTHNKGSLPNHLSPPDHFGEDYKEAAPNICVAGDMKWKGVGKSAAKTLVMHHGGRGMAATWYNVGKCRAVFFSPLKQQGQRNLLSPKHEHTYSISISLPFLHAEVTKWFSW